MEKLDFRTSAGFLNGHDERAQHQIPGAGPTVVITDLGMLKPISDSRELTLVARYEDVTVDKVRAATGWPLAVADTVEVIPPPNAEELRVLRDLHARTRVAHATPVLPAARKFSSAPTASHSHLLA